MLEDSSLGTDQSDLVKRNVPRVSNSSKKPFYKLFLDPVFESVCNTNGYYYVGTFTDYNEDGNYHICFYDKDDAALAKAILLQDLDAVRNTRGNYKAKLIDPNNPELDENDETRHNMSNLAALGNDISILEHLLDNGCKLHPTVINNAMANYNPDMTAFLVKLNCNIDSVPNILRNLNTRNIRNDNTEEWDQFILHLLPLPKGDRGPEFSQLLMNKYLILRNHESKVYNSQHPLNVPEINYGRQHILTFALAGVSTALIIFGYHILPTYIFMASAAVIGTGLTIAACMSPTFKKEIASAFHDIKASLSHTDRLKQSYKLEAQLQKEL